MRAGPCLGPLSLPLDQTPPSFDIQIISAILEGLVITAGFGKLSAHLETVVKRFILQSLFCWLRLYSLAES
jgi:hypothetical protein